MINYPPCTFQSQLPTPLGVTYNIRHNQTIVIASPSALNSTTNICQCGKRRIYIKPKHFCLSLNRDKKNQCRLTPKHFHESHQFGPTHFQIGPWPPLAARVPDLGRQSGGAGTAAASVTTWRAGRGGTQPQHHQPPRPAARSSSLSAPPQRPPLPCPASFAFSRLTCWILV